MPRLSELRRDPADVTAGRVDNPAIPMAATPQQIPSDLRRNSMMIASLPGLGSGPDAVIRQFNGGRDVPRRRILVP